MAMKDYDRIDKHKGMALITVLLVFFIASLLSVAMIDRQQIDIHRTENFLNQSQLYLNALAAEELAQELLWLDYNQDIENIRTNPDGAVKDTMQEDWNESITLALELGEIDLKIIDLQSLFNLNKLVKNTEIDPLAVEAFKELMKVLGVSNPELISESVIFKLQNEGQISSVSELRALENLTSADYLLLRPCLSVLSANTPLNINTASETVLSAWSNIIVPNQRDDLLLERERSRGLNSLPNLPGDLSGFSVNSEYFQVNIKAEFQGKYLYWDSVLLRDSQSGTLYVVSRTIKQVGFSESQDGNLVCDAS